MNIPLIGHKPVNNDIASIFALTPELAEKRAEARKIFPNCEFLPGDPCPVGSTVYENGREGIVVSPYTGNGSEIGGDFYGWWVVDLVGKHTIKNTLQWPPTLKTRI